MKKGRSNGRQVKAASAPQVPTESDAKVSSVYHIPDEDKKTLSELDIELSRTKLNIASITMQIESAKGQRTQMISQVREASQKYQDTVAEAAKKCGLDFKVSSWNFDPVAQTFSPTS